MSSTPNAVDWEEVERSEDFTKLRKNHRSFVFPLSAAFLIWYFGYVLLAAYAPAFMATPVFGAVNIGLVLGLGQFVTTFVVTAWYVNHANKVHDPLAEKIYSKIEKGDKH
jgi:uncharacterized membrane protein (DUF485 family)